MFDNNHIDEFNRNVRGILENGQEEVPQKVWEGVSSELDKLAWRKGVVLWGSRIGAVAATAAAVVAGILLIQRPQGGEVPAAEESLIAVAEPKQAKSEPTIAKASQVYMSIPEEETVMTATHMQKDNEQVSQQQSDKAHISPASASEDSERYAKTKEEAGQESIDWESETEKPDRKIRASLVISGIAGTNSPSGKGRQNAFMSPVKNHDYTATTVEQTSSQIAYGIPVSAGIGVKLNFTPKWSLGMGLNYTLLTSKFEGKYIKVLEDGAQEPAKYADIRNMQHYIGIPVNAYYNIINREYINFYAYAGGTVEKCVMNKYDVLTSPTIHHSETVTGVQLSANAGIGVEFLIGRYVGLYLDPSLRYYFNCGQPKSIRSAQPLMLGFEMGLRFNL